MSVIIKNVSFNFLSEAWLAVLTFVSLPIIVGFMGADAFGNICLNSERQQRSIVRRKFQVLKQGEAERGL